MGLIRYRLMNQ
jgi:hypothetical protein